MIHYMHLNCVPFEKIKSGTKTIELRLYDEKRQKIRVGDTIVFDNLAQPGDTLSVIVKNLYRFESFDDLFKALSLQKCGYSESEISKASANDMLEYYSAEKQAKYGAIGIEIELCEV